MTGMLATQQRRAWVAVGVWLLLQITLTSLPGSAFPPSPVAGLDRVAHFCLYFGMAFLVARAWLGGGRRPALLPLLWIALLAYAALDELHQMLIPGRSAEVGDWIMDAAGSAMGFLAGYLLMRARWAERLLR